MMSHDPRREATQPSLIGTEQQVTCERVVVGGDGLVRIAGRAVFVDGLLPGERARVRVDRFTRGRYQGSIVELESVNPRRRSAPCPYYLTCGGCDLQHAEIDLQREIKREALLEALQRIGGIAVEGDSVDMIAGDEWRHRARVRVFREPGQDAQAVGFRARASHSVVAVEDCIVSARPLLRAAAQLPAAAWKRGSRGGQTLEATLVNSADGVRVGGVDPIAEYRIGPLRLTFDPASFAQANPGLLAALGDRLVAPLRGSRRIMELYAGAGHLSALALAAWQEDRDGERPSRLVAVESDRRNAHLLKENLLRAADGVEVEVIPEGVDAAIASIDAALNDSGAGLIVDPPRAGLSKRLCELLAMRTPRGIAYLSCDPATLARDLARLCTTMRIVSITLVDLFPQTSHIETLVHLEPQ